MTSNQNPLEYNLWAKIEYARGSMDMLDFRNYILGLVFFEYLSKKLETHLNNELKNEKLTFKEAYGRDEHKDHLKHKAIMELGYFLEPNLLFSSIYDKVKAGEFILDDLKRAFYEISESSVGYESEYVFYNIFEDVDLNSSRLGKTASDKNRAISNILLDLAETGVGSDFSNIGETYEYLFGFFASSAGKRAGEFYTPSYVSKILAKIVSMDKGSLKNVFDPTCGTGSLLLRVGSEVSHVGMFYGQEINQSTYNLAKMNMILHGIDYHDFDIKQGDSLEDPKHLDKKFEVIVADIPFSMRWSADKKFLEDGRFSECGKLAPKSKADYAFVQHMIYHLDENGVMAVIVPHGVLFRGASEYYIRKYLIEKNYLDAVIGLPANIFYSTSIPVCILVFKKSRYSDDSVFFIDASKHFKKFKNQNMLRDEDIERIIRTYWRREEIEKFSHNATLNEIRRNDYNLNIPRYVDTFEKKEPIDLDKVCDELERVSREIEKVDGEIRECCHKLGIRPPIFLNEKFG